MKKFFIESAGLFYSYLREQKAGPREFIFPDAYHADYFQKQMQEYRLLNQDDSYVTIDHFINSGLGEKKKRVLKRSETYLFVLRYLYQFKKNISRTYHDYVYRIFTDLRTMTRDNTLYQDIIQKNYPDIKEELHYLWNLFEETSLIDEAKKYDCLMEEVVFPQKEYFFNGFTHLNALQIDWLNSFTQPLSIILPLEGYYDETPENWYHWLSGESLVFTRQEKKQEVDLFFIENLDQISCSPEENYNIAIDALEITPAHFGEIKIKDINYKVSTEFLSAEKEELNAFLLTKWFEKQALEISCYLEKIKNFVFNEQSVEVKKLVLFERIQEIIVFLEKIDSDFKKITREDHEIIFQALEWNLPRSFFKNSKKSASEVRKLEHYSLGGGSKKKNIIYFSSKTKDFLQKKSEMTLENFYFLREIIPLKNHHIVDYYKMLAIRSLLEEGGIIYVNEESWKVKSELKKFLSTTYSLVLPQKTTSEISHEKKYLFLEKKKGGRERFSLSQIQTYHECPLRYYLKYEKNIYFKTTVLEDFNALEKGSLVHELIGRVFVRNLTEKQQQKYIAQEVEKYCLTHKKMDVRKIERNIYEVSILVTHGLLFLEEFKKEHPDARYVFEQKVTSEKTRGLIDVLIFTKKGVYLIDFKLGTLPKKDEIIHHEKIQLSSYASKVKENVLGFFYYSLKEQKKVGVSFVDNFLEKANAPQDFLNHYQKYEEGIVNKMLKDESFFPKPLKKEVCIYCYHQEVCPKI